MPDRFWGDSILMKKKRMKLVLLVILALIISSILGFYIWSQNTYSAIEDLPESVKEQDGWLLFEADDPQNGLVLYPGAKVEPDAYAFLGEELASQGITVAIPSVRLNLPIFDLSKADELFQREGVDSLNWYIGGHSMGGAAAAMYADANLDKVSGLVLLGAYAADNDYLQTSQLPVLSISGSEDGLSTPEKINQYRQNLSDTAQFIEIEGGNHAQFGVYGPQSGDNEAAISVDKQQEMIITTILEWIDDQGDV